MQKSGDSAVNITVETCSSGMVVPPWICTASATGRDDILVIYPNEATRSNTVQSILRGSGSVDSSRHTTLQRLIKSLAIDFRLPVVVPQSSLGLVQVHQKFSAAAAKHRFPRLHPDVNRPWTLSKSERLLKLHSYGTDHQILSKWDGDPGAHEAERILLTFEKEELLHEHQLLAKLCVHLLDTNIPVPYTIGSVAGIVLLNHPPDFSENEKRFLKALSSRCPIHHVCVDGSFRLGFHGAFIDDEIKPVEREEDLPSWIPPHPLQQVEAKPNDYTTEGVHVISFDRATQVMDATISALQHYRSSAG